MKIICFKLHTIIKNNNKIARHTVVLYIQYLHNSKQPLIPLFFCLCRINTKNYEFVRSGDLILRKQTLKINMSESGRTSMEGLPEENIRYREKTTVFCLICVQFKIFS